MMKSDIRIKLLLMFSCVINSIIMSMENPKSLPVAIGLQKIINKTDKNLTLDAHYSALPLSKKFSFDFKNITLHKGLNSIKKDVPLEYQVDSGERYALLVFKGSMPTIALKIVHKLSDNNLRVMIGIYGDSMLKELIKMDNINISNQEQVNLNAVIDGYRSDFNINFDTDIPEMLNDNKKPKKSFSLWKKQ